MCETGQGEDRLPKTYPNPIKTNLYGPLSREVSMCVSLSRGNKAGSVFIHFVNAALWGSALLSSALCCALLRKFILLCAALLRSALLCSPVHSMLPVRGGSRYTTLQRGSTTFKRIRFRAWIICRFLCMIWHVFKEQWGLKEGSA